MDRVDEMDLTEELHAAFIADEVLRELVAGVLQTSCVVRADVGVLAFVQFRLREFSLGSLPGLADLSP